MNSFVLAGALTFSSPVAEFLPDADAAKYVVKALYKQIDGPSVVSHIEKKYLRLDKYPELGYIGVVVRIGTERRVTYRWEF